MLEVVKLLGRPDFKVISIKLTFVKVDKSLARPNFFKTILLAICLGTTHITTQNDVTWCNFLKFLSFKVLKFKGREVPPQSKINGISKINRK